MLNQEQQDIIYSFIIGKMDSKRFEEFIYNNSELEKNLGYEDYLNLIEINFKDSQSAVTKTSQLFLERIDIGTQEKQRILNALDSLIFKSPNVPDSLMEIYDAYCEGYDFLKPIALNQALTLSAPPNATSKSGEFAGDYWDLPNSEKISLIDSFYPELKRISQEIKSLITNRKIIFLNKQNKEIDNIITPGHRVVLKINES